MQKAKDVPSATMQTLPLARAIVTSVFTYFLICTGLHAQQQTVTVTAPPVKPTSKPAVSDDDLVYSGSIGASNSPVQSKTKEFREIKDVLGEPLIFVPLTGAEAFAGYGLEVTGPDGREMTTAELAGKEITVISNNKSEAGKTFYGAKFPDHDGLTVTPKFSARPLLGLIRKSLIESARKRLKGKTLWLRTNRLLTYDAVANKLESHKVSRLQPVEVEHVVVGTTSDPIRLIVRTKSGEQFFQQFPCPGGVFEGFEPILEGVFYVEDPRKKFSWPDEIVHLIENSKIQFGMTRDQVAAAWDGPDKKNVISSRGTLFEQWVYGDQFIYFEDGKYIDYQKFESH